MSRDTGVTGTSGDHADLGGDDLADLRRTSPRRAARLEAERARTADEPFDQHAHAAARPPTSRSTSTPQPVHEPGSTSCRDEDVVPHHGYVDGPGVRRAPGRPRARTTSTSTPTSTTTRGPVPTSTSTSTTHPDEPEHDPTTTSTTTSATP